MLNTLEDCNELLDIYLALNLVHLTGH
jgi:hypothetical protein